MKVRSLIFPVLSVLFAAVSCSRPNAVDVTSEKPSVVTVQYHADSTLGIIKMYCYACHNPGAASHDAIIAPPLAAVKIRYARVYPDRSQFIDSLSSFLAAPSKEKAIMPGPVARFGVMPAVSLTEKELRAIAAYMYDQKLQEPVWFQDHMKEQGH